MFLIYCLFTGTAGPRMMGVNDVAQTTAEAFKEATEEVLRSPRMTDKAHNAPPAYKKFLPDTKVFH